MAIQDLLTVAIESTFVASVVFFSVQFALFVASHPSSRCRRRYSYVTPMPIATPVQPVSPQPVQTALAADCTSYTASLPETHKTAAKASRKPHTAVITVPVLKTYKLRGDDVVLIEDLTAPLPNGCKTYLLRGKQAVKV